jgi:hypothetical protein
MFTYPAFSMDMPQEATGTTESREFLIEDLKKFTLATP